MEVICIRLGKEMDGPSGSSMKCKTASNATSSTFTRVFNCARCGLKEKYHYYGRKPPFVKNFIFLEDVYVAKDPFSPSGEGLFLMLGGNCAVCMQPVCQSQKCSIFYAKRFCLPCAKNNYLKFPDEVKKRVLLT